MKKLIYNKTFTKKLTFAMLIVGTISANTPYILSLFGKEPVESLGIAWVSGVVCIALGYFIRGYKDTKAEKDHELDDYYVHSITGDLKQ